MEENSPGLAAECQEVRIRVGAFQRTGLEVHSGHIETVRVGPADMDSAGKDYSWPLPWKGDRWAYEIKSDLAFRAFPGCHRSLVA